MMINAWLNGVKHLQHMGEIVWNEEEELGDSEVPRAHLSH